MDKSRKCLSIVGAGGQVGAEVTILLSRHGGLSLFPIVRTRSGSAFLRYHNVAVLHGSVTDEAFACRAFSGMDVIANFALASGTPSEAKARNSALIHAVFSHSPPEATIVFFSTLAVNGTVDATGRNSRSAYGDLKLANERLVMSLARKSGRKAFVLRLGHVVGQWQGITTAIREEIMSGDVVLPEPDRESNVTHTVTIADALMAICSDRAGPPGIYDLTNFPQWSWREVYENEASQIGVPISFHAVGDTPHQRIWLPKSRIASSRVKNWGSRILRYLPNSLNSTVRARYFVSRAKREIADLKPQPKVTNPASLWPKLTIRPLEGVQSAHDLLETVNQDLSENKWPKDIPLP